MLTVHATIEEEIFYPAARLDEAEVEHASAKELIAQIELMKASDPLYDANCHDQDRAPWTMEDTWACGPAWVEVGLTWKRLHQKCEIGILVSNSGCQALRPSFCVAFRVPLSCLCHTDDLPSFHDRSVDQSYLLIT